MKRSFNEPKSLFRAACKNTYHFYVLSGQRTKYPYRVYGTKEFLIAGVASFVCSNKFMSAYRLAGINDNVRSQTCTDTGLRYEGKIAIYVENLIPRHSW